MTIDLGNRFFVIPLRDGRFGVCDRKEVGVRQVFHSREYADVEANALNDACRTVNTWIYPENPFDACEVL